jgi:NTE family protein
LEALAITASSYTTGQSITWVQGRRAIHWERAQRVSQSAKISTRHVLGSCALPLFFPAVQVEGAWYGDGGMRLTAPFSPAVHLGADRILAISTRYARTREEADQPVIDGYPPPAQVAGVLLNSIFLDQFDGDALRLERINQLVAGLDEAQREGLRPIELCVLRPSRDLGKLANEFEPRLSRSFRFLTRGFGTQRTRSNDFLSLVMFQPDYLRTLLELGRADGARRAREVCAFLRPSARGTLQSP